MIDVTNCGMRKLIAKAYELSVPQGLGFLHFTPRPLSDAEIDTIISHGKGTNYPVSMDYVNGRSIKLHVMLKEGKLLIPDRWYDHSDPQLAELCDAIGAVKPVRAE